jgi:hypothetical protein
MRGPMIAVCLLALSAGPALGADGPMAGYIGNTIVSKGGLYQARTHYRADHTFDLTGSGMGMSRTFKGTWSVDASGKLCRTYLGAAPPGSPISSCRPITPRKVGDTWTVGDGDDRRTATLKAGIQ